MKNSKSSRSKIPIVKLPRTKSIKKPILFGAAALVVLFGIGYINHDARILHTLRIIQTKAARQGWVAGEQIVRLDVPFHRQEHSLSCEIAALKMALDYVGIDVPESELISHLVFDPTPRANGVWGDPYKGFVGNIDGKMLRTGYGVYWDPIARVGLRYTRTEVIHDGTLQHLTSHIDQNRPVVVWGHFGRGDRQQWRTESGKLINAVNGEHARTLIGYTGDSHNPQTLILMDPIYGEVRFSAAEFLRNWEALEKGAVAVYHIPRWVRAGDSPTIWEISTDGKTKYGIAMAWEDFVTQGGFAEAVKEVSESVLGQMGTGGILKVLPPQ